MTATEALERRIDELCAENERLRQDNDRLIQAIEALHDVRLEDRLVQLENENDRLLKELEAEHALAETLGHHHEHAQSENAKLRELVHILCYCMHEGTDCDGCKLNDGRGEMGLDALWACDGLHELLRELGIEVDG